MVIQFPFISGIDSALSVPCNQWLVAGFTRASIHAWWLNRGKPLPWQAAEQVAVGQRERTQGLMLAAAM
jgi:hypothetical protein